MTNAGVRAAGAAAIVVLAATAASAGRVSVRQRVGDLRVRAAGADAVQIEIVALGDGAFAVNALDPGTSVEGTSGVVVRNVTGDVLVRGTRAGDTIRVRSEDALANAIRGSLRIDARGGDDTVSVDRQTVEERVVILTRDGDDAVALTACELGDDCEIVTSAGDDTVTVSGSTIAEDLVVATESGVDGVRVEESTLREDLTVDCGSGDDAVDVLDSTIDGDLAIALSSGTNGATVAGTAVAGDLGLTAGRGDDVVALEVVDADDDLRVTLGKGDDRLSLTNVLVGDELKVLCGGGADVATLSTVGAAIALVAADPGRDLVDLRDGCVFGQAELDGGAGAADQLTGDGTTVFEKGPRIRRFEIVPLVLAAE